DNFYMACVSFINYGNSTTREMSSQIPPIEFMTEILNGILATNQPPTLINWDSIPLPELLLFVGKVTTKAGIDYNTAMVALVLLSRLKSLLPKNARGEYGTCHRLFLSAILVASKNSTQKNGLYFSPPSSVEDLPFTRDEKFDDVISQTTWDTTNCNLAKISGIFTVQEVNEMEKDFRKLLGKHIFVDEKDVKDFIESNKYALGYY
ncbi:10824_t:CDS:2, partial [Acaulospora morrowiae]